MTKIYPTTDIATYSKIASLLGYKEDSIKTLPFSSLSIVKYKKENEVINFKSLKDRYLPSSTVPFFFVVLFAVIAICLATTFLILNIINKEADKLLYFFSLMIPTFLLILLATALSFYRYWVTLKNLEKVAAIPLLEKEVK